MADVPFPFRSKSGQLQREQKSPAGPGFPMTHCNAGTVSIPGFS
jgi:hypothetical protein